MTFLLKQLPWRKSTFRADIAKERDRGRVLEMTQRLFSSSVPPFLPQILYNTRTSVPILRRADGKTPHLLRMRKV